MNTNKFGLPRRIPEEVKRKVRQNSKFGCVFCRCAIYEYEHIVPTFKEAITHDPDKICLLCGQCHNKVTKGVLSKESVLRKYNEIKHNELVKRPFETIDLSVNTPEIVIGNCKFINPKKIIELDNQTILALNPSHDNNGLPSLSGIFSDRDGKELISIKDNEWQGSIEHWDLVTQGRIITIRHSQGHIALKIELIPPSKIVVHTLDIEINGCHMYCHNGIFKIGKKTKNEEIYIEIDSLIAQHPDVGISVANEITPLDFRGMRVTGGEGFFLDGTGISLAQRSGQMWLKGFTIELATKQATIRRSMFEENNLQGSMEILPPRIK